MKGYWTIAGVGVEGNAAERAGVRFPVGAVHGAGAGVEWRRWDVSVCRDHDTGLVDVVKVLEFDSEVVLPPVVDGGVGDSGGAEFGGNGNARDTARTDYASRRRRRSP